LHNWIRGMDVPALGENGLDCVWFDKIILVGLYYYFGLDKIIWVDMDVHET